MFSHAGRFLLGLALLAVFFDPVRAAEIPVDGQVLGVDGTHLPGVRVELRPALPRYEAGVLESAAGDELAPVAQDVTSSLGRFRVSVPRAGLWRMVARADGYVPMEIPVFPVLEERSLPAVRLRPDRGLRVRVVGPDGKPISGVRVLGQTEKAVLWGALWQPSGRLAVSGPDGGLRLSRAAGEPLRLWAAGPGFPAQGGILADKGDAVLQLQKGERHLDGKLPLALTAPATGHWTGRIVDASSRRPVAGALVWASDDPGSATLTDAAGTYRLSGRVPGSHGRLQAAAVEYASNSLSVDLPLGSSAGFQKVADLPVVPAPVPAISGVVMDEAAKPVAGAEILLVRPDPEAGAPPQLRRARTSPAGSFRIGRLQAGSFYALTASRPGFAPATLQVTVPLPTQSQAAIRLTLRLGRTASGLIVDPRRRPISGAAVRLIPAEARAFFPKLQPELGPFQAATGPDGRFRIPNLPAGLFELRIEGSELAPLPNKEISVPGGGGSVDLGTFTLEGRTRVAGWIVDPGGQPLEGVEIWVVPEDHAEITQATHQVGPATVTGPDGRYELLDRAVGSGEELRACRKGFVPKEFPAKGKVPEALRTVLAPTVHLAGHVVGADGESLPGARILASGHIMPDPPCAFAKSALTGAEGAFALELEEAGWYEVAARGAGHLSTRLDRLHVPPEGLDGLEIRMDGGTTVSGHLADPKGHPVVGAEILLSGPRSFVEASSDDGGNFLLEGVETGEENVSVTHADFATEERKVQIRPEGTRIDLVLHPVSLSRSAAG
ncbi:MAG TPA: carboxypeptidase-like regulatory domain-containing protein [Thermoanaerobaculia bacterium]|jgi:hypothetical protein|nr:carboxypeptidase-like regulatory domain-containing protein [Thermoanaerobaculia bacterium]